MTELKEARIIPEVKQMEEDEVLEYCNDNLIRIENFFSPEGVHRCELCADARHTAMERSSHPGAFFGGDFGRIIQLLALRNVINGVTRAGKVKKRGTALAKLDNQEILGLVAQSVGGLHNIRFHIDEGHGKKDFDFIIENGLALFLRNKRSATEPADKKINIGCGHINQVLNYPKKYGLTMNDRDFLIETLIFIYKRNMVHEQANGKAGSSTAFPLKGDHKERAIVVLDSKKYTLGTRMTLPDGSEQQVFLLHNSFGEEVEDNLFERLKGFYDSTAGVTMKQLRAALGKVRDSHIGLTKEALPSAKKLAIWHVKIDDSTGKVANIKKLGPAS